MSTGYCLVKKVSARDLFDGRLDEYGVREHIEPGKTSEKERCLTDGENYLPVSIDDDGFVSILTRYRGNAPGKILNAIADAFDTDIVSEYEPQFWGFDTNEEWEAWEEKMAREADDKFYIELSKYLRGEPHDIKPGTIGMIKAKIAAKLVEKDQTLLLPENKDKLLTEIESIYRRDHMVRVTLDPQQTAFAAMLVTHKDDLPRA